MIAVDDKPPPTCIVCGADRFACSVKRGLGGRACCERCDHADDGVGVGARVPSPGDPRPFAQFSPGKLQTAPEGAKSLSPHGRSSS